MEEVSEIIVRRSCYSIGLFQRISRYGQDGMGVIHLEGRRLETGIDKMRIIYFYQEGIGILHS